MIYCSLPRGRGVPNTRSDAFLYNAHSGSVETRRVKMCISDNFSVRAEAYESSAGRIGIVFKKTSGEIVRNFPDVCVDYLWAKSFCERCNLSGISQIHILDVLEDSLP